MSSGRDNTFLALPLTTGHSNQERSFTNTSCSADLGGAMYISGASPTTTGRTFSENMSTDGWPEEGSINANPRYAAGQSGTGTSAGVYDANTGQTTTTNAGAA